MLKDKIFLDKLVECAKLCGWSVDMIEVENFVRWVHTEMGEPCPDIDAYSDCGLCDGEGLYDSVICTACDGTGRSGT